MQTPLFMKLDSFRRRRYQRTMYKKIKIWNKFVLSASYYLIMHIKKSSRVVKYCRNILFSGRQSKLSFEELTKWAHDSDICFVELEVAIVD